MTWIGGALTQWSGTAEPGWNGEALSHTRAPRNSGTTEYANLGALPGAHRKISSPDRAHSSEALERLDHALHARSASVTRAVRHVPRQDLVQLRPVEEWQAVEGGRKAIHLSMYWLPHQFWGHSGKRW